MAKNLVDGTSTNIEENGNNISIQINFPIGYIYMSTSSTNPSTYFGGQWQRIAKGRTLVGVDENDTDFSSAELTGGEKTHTLIVSELPSNVIQTATTGSNADGYIMRGGYTSTGTYNIGGSGNAHNIMQPYFTCYIWEKVGN